LGAAFPKGKLDIQGFLQALGYIIKLRIFKIVHPESIIVAHPVFPVECTWLFQVQRSLKEKSALSLANG